MFFIVFRAIIMGLYVVFNVHIVHPWWSVELSHFIYHLSRKIGNLK